MAWLICPVVTIVPPHSHAVDVRASVWVGTTPGREISLNRSREELPYAFLVDACESNPEVRPDVRPEGRCCIYETNTVQSVKFRAT